MRAAIWATQSACMTSHGGTAIHPRAACFHQRTLKIFRDAGIQKALEQADERAFAQNGAINAVE